MTGVYRGIRAGGRLFPQSNSQIDLLVPESWRKVSFLLLSLLKSPRERQELYFFPLLPCVNERSVSWVGDDCRTSFKVK